MVKIQVGGDGRLTLQFSHNHCRYSSRLGPIGPDQAEQVRLHVGNLIAADQVGVPPEPATLLWLMRISDRLHQRLVRAGLASPRQRATLGPWLEEYLQARRIDVKPATIVKLDQTRWKLVSYLGADRPIRSISVTDAAGWWAWLRNAGLSEAAAKIHVGNAKQFANEAIRRGLIRENPFRHLRSGSTPSVDERYVTPEQAKEVIDACETPEARLAFGLARYAGVRFDSETCTLTWECVEWDKARLHVRSPKTERHPGHGERVVPIDPRLMRLLCDHQEHLGPQATSWFTSCRSTICRQVSQAIYDAEIPPWSKLWQSLRSSCEREWAMTYPQYAVSKWMGHSITVSGRHYTPVPDELYYQAAEGAHLVQKQPRADGTDRRLRRIERQLDVLLVDVVDAVAVDSWHGDSTLAGSRSAVTVPAGDGVHAQSGTNAMDQERFPQIICEIYRLTAELEAMFPGRPFTPDGHMVGSIGEVLAAYHYGLKLLPPSAPSHDATKDGKLVQIKATQGKLVALRSEPQYLLVLKLHKDGSFEEVYNGPGQRVWGLVSSKSRPDNGQYPVSLSQLRRLAATVPASERIVPSVQAVPDERPST